MTTFLNAPTLAEQIGQSFRKFQERYRSALTVSNLAKQIRLSDGRWLGYAEFGSARGKPVFFFHGLPGSRLFRHPNATIASSLGVRLITIDRPGFGLSDSRPGRQLVDWPNDVVELADSLGLKRFAVAGISAGGPYAAACAYKIPDRLTAIALISSVAPWQAPGVTEGMDPAMQLNFSAAGSLPGWVLQPAMGMMAWTGRHHPEEMWQRIVVHSPECDRRILNQSEVKTMFLSSIRETYRQGSRGHSSEAPLIARDWGFQLEDITARVYVWHGRDDVQAPLAMGQYLANTIPNCKAAYLPREGHFLMFKPNYWRDILTALVSA